MNLKAKYFGHFFMTMVMHLSYFEGNSQEIKISGVHQGKSIYIQNPLLPNKNSYCIKSISVNHKALNVNNKVSALELRFDDIELYTPITIRIKHYEGCTPVVLNPEAVHFHSTFGFREISLSDTSLVWKTRGEKSGNMYEIERLYADGWSIVQEVPSKGIFGGTDYHVLLELSEGPNKFRIKYIQTESDRILYSDEVELVYYPEPITIFPYTVTDKLYISRVSEYEISTGDGNIIMSGKGKEIMLKNLRRGEYFITIGDKVEKFIKN